MFKKIKMSTTVGLEPTTFHLGGERPTIGLRGQFIIYVYDYKDNPRSMYMTSPYS